MASTARYPSLPPINVHLHHDARDVRDWPEIPPSLRNAPPFSLLMVRFITAIRCADRDFMYCECQRVLPREILMTFSTAYPLLSPQLLRNRIPLEYHAAIVEKLVSSISRTREKVDVCMGLFQGLPQSNPTSDPSPELEPQRAETGGEEELEDESEGLEYESTRPRYGSAAATPAEFDFFFTEIFPSSDFMEQLEKVKLRDASSVSSKGPCCVCLEEYEVGEEISELPCSHVFHSSCIVPWLNKSPQCPLCRGPATHRIG